MAAWAAAARQAASLSRLSSPTSAAQASKLIQRRGLAGGADPHGTPRVNCWSDPLSPAKWKEEHLYPGSCTLDRLASCKNQACDLSPTDFKFVIVSLSGWGLLIYGGYKLFSGGKKEKKEEQTVGASPPA